MRENILETTKLTKIFMGKPVVESLNMNVRRNTVYGLLGPNGAGKSTTLKMLTGILRPSSGSIVFDGHKWSRKDLWNISALIETPPLYDNLTAEENLLVKVKMLGIDSKKIKEV